MRTKEILDGVGLFQKGYKLEKVARQLRITFKTAKQLQRIYWQSEEIAKQILSRNIGDIYFDDLEEKERQEKRARLVEGLLKKLRRPAKSAMFYEEDIDSATWQVINLTRRIFPEADCIMVPLKPGPGLIGWSRV